MIHNPYAVGDGSGSSDQLKAAWKVFEELKDEGKLKAIGVSNFRPQDLKAILSDCKHKPAVHQLEFHPYLLAHLKPVLDIHKEHGIVAASYGPLSPILRNKGGRLDAVLSEIAQRVKKDAPHGAKVDETSVLLLCELIRAKTGKDLTDCSRVLGCKAQDIVAVTTSGNLDRSKSTPSHSHRISTKTSFANSQKLGCCGQITQLDSGRSRKVCSLPVLYKSVPSDPSMQNQ